MASRPNGLDHLSIDSRVGYGRVFGSANYLGPTQAELATLQVPATMLDGQRWPVVNARVVLDLLLHGEEV